MWQFQPVMVKKDDDQRPKKNSGKAVTNGRANENVDALGNVESSSAAASSQASA